VHKVNVKAELLSQKLHTATSCDRRTKLDNESATQQCLGSCRALLSRFRIEQRLEACMVQRDSYRHHAKSTICSLDMKLVQT
jgi:hypothetical protein